MGKAIDLKVTELVKTGTLKYLEELRREFPHGALDLVRIPGLGPRKAAVLIRELDVASLDDLEKAAQAGRVRGLKGFGEKTEQSILEGIARARERQAARKPLWETRPLAEQLLVRVRGAAGVVRAEIAGSVRRYAETNGDVDVVAACKGPPEAAMDAFAQAPGVVEVLARGGTKCSVRLRDGLQADLRVVTETQFATALHHFTGSKQHHVKLRGIARSKGLSISEYGLAPLAGGAAIEPQSEEELYSALGLAPVPPELREDLGEIELAERRELPQLVELRDIKGFVPLPLDLVGRKGLHRGDGPRGAGAGSGVHHHHRPHQRRPLRERPEHGPAPAAVGRDRGGAGEDSLGRILRGSEVDILEDARSTGPPRCWTSSTWSSARCTSGSSWTSRARPSASGGPSCIRSVASGAIPPAAIWAIATPCRRAGRS